MTKVRLKVPRVVVGTGELAGCARRVEKGH